MPRLLSLTTHAYLPQKYGGSETGTHALLSVLKTKGWQVAVACALLPDGVVGLKHRLASRIGWQAYADTDCGYPAYRRWHVLQALPQLLEAFCPDVVVIQAGAPSACLQALQTYSGPVVVYVHDALFETWGGLLRPAPNHRFVAVSAFVQKRLKDVWGVDSVVIHTPIEDVRFRQCSAGSEALLINPHPLKGGDLALAIAERCPEIPFRVVECWSLLAGDRTRLLAQAQRLKNVEWQTPTPDMPSVYARARVLLVPSQCDDAFPTVVREAQYAGVPALASKRGGIPDVVGDGGVLLSSDASADAWADALRRLWSPTEHASYARQARAMAELPERQAEFIVGQFLQQLECAVSHEI